jgi:arylsulfatase A-like enzyme
MRDQGYETYLASGNNWVGPSTGIANGFNNYDLIGKQYPQGNLDAQTANFDRFLQNKKGDQPFFAMLHTMDVHNPYFAIPEVAGTWAFDIPFDETAGYPDQENEIRSEYAAGTVGLVEAVGDVYDEQVLGLDAQMGRLLALLEARGLAEDTLVVLTSDHGEMLGEGGQFGHNGTLEMPMIRIPLAMYAPGLKPEKVQCLSENVDTLPTILTALGVPVPDGLDGHPMQEGCRTYVRSSVYAPEGRVGILQVDNGTTRVYWGCGGNHVRYERDDGTFPEDAEAQALYDELVAFNEEIKAHVAGQESCVVPSFVPMP